MGTIAGAAAIALYLTRTFAPLPDGVLVYFYMLFGPCLVFAFLYGVFTVQNGLNFTMDFFLDCAAFLYAAIMWRHPAFGRVVALLSIALVGPHFAMKLATFPAPPAEAGLFDAGPLVGAWFTIATVCAAVWLWRQRNQQATASDVGAA